MEMNIRYYCDNARHLVCVPYSIENMKQMAKDLDIKDCWFHKDHYDMPVRRIDEIKNKCHIVSSRDIVRIIHKEIFIDNCYIKEHDVLNDGWRN